jgi:hypothetical protein
MNAPSNKSSIAVIVAVASLLTAGWANATQTDGRGKATEWTADRYVREQGITCVYGRPRIETDTDGRTIITTSKRCEATSR